MSLEAVATARSALLMAIVDGPLKEHKFYCKENKKYYNLSAARVKSRRIVRVLFYSEKILIPNIDYDLDMAS